MERTMESQPMQTTPVYIFSILGFLCCCFGGLGFIFAGIALLIAHSKMKEAELNPDMYSNYNAMKTAKMVALIILLINVLYLGMSIYRIYTVGWDEIMLQSQQMMEQYGLEAQ